MSTSGRGDYGRQILVWRWRATGIMAAALAHRLPAGYVPAWVAVVPPTEDRPEWVPADARAFALPDRDTAYTWGRGRVAPTAKAPIDTSGPVV